jgi:4a-hydroxytetrahydrobiopterin dehydratase
MAPLDDQEIQRRLREAADGWAREGDTIVRDWKLADFEQAIAFVNRVAALADQQGHHPDILVHGWNKVRLTLFTHSEGGLTAADFELAAEIDHLL